MCSCTTRTTPAVQVNQEKALQVELEGWLA